MKLAPLEKALSAAPGVRAWVLCAREQESRQRYRIFRKTESDRSARLYSAQVTVFTERPGDGGAVQGEASFTLTGEANGLDAGRIREAVARAGLVSNPPYVLPGPAEVTVTPLDDPRVSADPDALLADLEAEMDRAAGDTPVCASELFVDRNRMTVRTSEGFSGSYQASELFCEFVVLAEDGKGSVECHAIRRARRPEELDLAGAIARNARWAADRLRAELPPTGTIPVVFGEEALDTLFGAFASHAGARARYEGWSRLTEGKPLIDGVQGEPLTLRVDPALPWRLGSRPFDAEGQLTRPVTVCDGGRFMQRTASKRYADYLGIPATGSGGSLVVASGPTPLADLLAEGRVLHALRFSTFHPNPVTGAFSGELRTGYLHDGQGRITPVYGGSVSGNVWDAFRHARFSAERAVRPEYDGPMGVRLEEVTVAGRP